MSYLNEYIKGPITLCNLSRNVKKNISALYCNDYSPHPGVIKRIEARLPRGFSAFLTTSQQESKII